MNVTKCLNGHFFDADKYDQCPHCGAAKAVATVQQSTAPKKEGFFHKRKNKTVNKEIREIPEILEIPEIPENTDDKTVALSKESNNISVDADEKTVALSKESNDMPVDADEKTVALLKESNEMPVDTDEKTVALLNNNESLEPKIPNATNKFNDDEKTCVGEMFESFEPIAEPATKPQDIESDIILKGNKSSTGEQSSECDCSLKKEVENAMSGNAGKTLGFFNSSKAEASAEPVVGWIVCLKGKHFGESFGIVSGRNSIGRQADNKICLSKDGTISREKHAWITYEPKKREFFIQPGESSGLSYLNGENIMESKKLSSHDKVEFGNCVFVFIPLCGQDFSWEDYMSEE